MKNITNLEIELKKIKGGYTYDYCYANFKPHTSSNCAFQACMESASGGSNGGTGCSSCICRP